MVLQRVLQQRRKRRERRQVGMGIGRRTHAGAGQSIEHPGGNLKPTVRIGAAQATATNNTVRLVDRLVNTDPKTKPRMPWI
jgi:hypothetical protein